MEKLRDSRLEGFKQFLEQKVREQSTLEYSSDSDKQRDNELLERARQVYQDIVDNPRLHNPPYDTPLKELEFCVRTYNRLNEAGIETLGQLATMSRKEILTIERLGKTPFYEIRRRLENFNLALRSD